jgi:hypothetical protein
MWGDDGTYYHRLAVHSTIRSEGLRVERNYFHDSPTSDRNVELWYMNDGSYSNNVFFNINDGGHIMEPQNNVAFDYNIGRRIHRMGVEIQGDTPGNNLQVVGNVFYDWVKPYYDTFGLSIVAHFRTNTLISQNYMLASHDGAWGLPDESGQNRFGFGIEAGFASGVVQNNIIAGPWAGGIVNSTKGNLVKNNTFYGHQLWASIMAEPGPYGMSSFTSIGNVFKDLSELPDPPATVDGVAPNWPVGGGTGTFDPDPTPGGPAPMLNAFVIDGTQILLSWHDNFTDESGYIVQRSRDGKTWADVWDSHAANITQYTDKGLPNGAQFYYRVGAYKKGTDGVYGVYSNIVAPKTKGIASGPGAGLNGFTRGLQRVPTNSQDPLDGLFGNNPSV